MHRLKSNLLWVALMLWVGIAQVYWQLGPHIASYSNASLHTSAYEVLKGLTLLGSDILILLLGYFLSQKSHRESTIIKAWLNTLVLGVLASVLVALSTNQLAKVTVFHTDFFNAVFPLLRNAYPLIFGSLLGLILTEVINDQKFIWRRPTLIGIWLLMIVPLFWTPNIWGWTSNHLTLFYALLFVLGANIKHESHHRKWILITGLGLLITVVLQGIMPFMSIDGQTASRFTTPTNIFTVLAAYGIVKIAVNHLGQPNWRSLYSYLTLIENTALLASVQLIVKLHNAYGSLKAGIITIIFLLFALACSYVWCRLSTGNFAKRHLQQIDRFTSQSADEQFQLIKQRLNSWMPNIILGFISYLIAALSMLLMNDGFSVSPNVDATYNIFAYTFGQRELLLLFTAFLIFAVIKFIQALTNRYWIGVISVIAISAVFVVANHEKIVARNEPILPADLAMVRVAKNLFGMVDGVVWIVALVTLVVLIAVTVWLEKTHPLRNAVGGVTQRLLFVLLAPCLFATAFLWNHQNTPFNNLMTSIDDQPMFYNQLSGARINGPLLQFMNNIDVTVMAKPTGYSRQTMTKIVRKYHLDAQQINRQRTNSFSKQTIIFNLSESFANPQRVPGVQLKNNPVPYITKLSKQNTGGLMISSGYGGGTANMEYMALTGFALTNFSPTLPTPYTQLVNNLKNNPSIAQQFKSAIAIHPYNGAFYNRTEVYRKFGIDRFLYLGSKYPIRHQKKIDRSPYLSDQTSYQNVLDQLMNYHGGRFINLVTMQNHFPYNQHYYNEISKYQATKVSAGTDKSSVNDFATGIHHTDEAMKQFITAIDKIERPITVVFYGDHLPGIYGNEMTKDGLKLHETDYFIYSNRYAREHGARNFKQKTAYVAPNDFIAMAAKQTNSKVDWYQALLTRVYEQLPVITEDVQASGNVNAYNSNSRFITQKGKILKENQLTKKQKALLHDYRLVQYDVTAGKHYVVKTMK
ncbi:LTA synthase family protein [Limosilactobacillus vaginalis]|uniref:LTA synthase family protein n=1 Tax=Limosilactobacillus vaginalis TaxID=1633 RepID=UPI0025A48741|nr:alkaline phosphatase family protein [Limosilactobacillus vaginalis]MDM8221883.1 sulfatase-like hydrolase/transferase [Limosilactobacillus vaginalis]